LLTIRNLFKVESLKNKVAAEMMCNLGGPNNMLSNTQIKLIRSLHQKKFRTELALSMAEGSKLVIDLLQNNLPVRALICTMEWQQENRTMIPPGMEIWTATMAQMEKVSALKTPSPVMLLLEIKEEEQGSAPLPQEKDLFVFLDDIRDPGNLGTLIRTCDWFGIRHLIVSETTVAFTSPKVIQATMGSFGRVKIYVENAEKYLKRCATAGIGVAGAFMEGEPVQHLGMEKPGLLIIGNEGQGISQQLLPLINKKICIESGPKAAGLAPAESLNASVAAAILIFAIRNY
jgi:RNA methyltransferase, TrmH family